MRSAKITAKPRGWLYREVLRGFIHSCIKLCSTNAAYGSHSHRDCWFITGSNQYQCSLWITLSQRLLVHHRLLRGLLLTLHTVAYSKLQMVGSGIIFAQRAHPSQPPSPKTWIYSQLHKALQHQCSLWITFSQKLLVHHRLLRGLLLTLHAVAYSRLLMAGSWTI